MRLNSDGEQSTPVTKVLQRRISKESCKGDFPSGWSLGENRQSLASAKQSN